MKFKYLLVLFLHFAFCGVLLAQQKVTGIVKDINGKAIDGASIQFKGIKSGTTSNEKGNFSIPFPGTVTRAVLIISAVGYQKTETTVVPGQDIVSLMTIRNDNSLDDVVIVGVQVQSKRKTTSAVSSVFSKDIQNLPAPSVDQLLQGRVAGLNVQISSGEPGVSPSMVIRGNSKLNTNIDNNNVAQAQALSSPLYVIDGIPTNPEDIANSIDATGTNFLAGLNVNDIESVDVQKDAAATAAWGSRGANGVIYIKTKRGISSTPEFRINMYGGFTRQPELLKTYTGAAERAEKMKLINIYASPANLTNIPQVLTDPFNPAFNNATDWQGLFYRQGSVKNVDATVSAATDIVNYRVSLNYYDEKGIINSFGFTRYSLRGNFDFKISPKVNSQLIVALSKADRQRGKKYYNNSDENIPLIGSSQPSSLYRLTSFDSSNFQGIYSKLRNKNVNDYYSASFILNYKILSALKYTFQGSANITSSSRDYFQPSNINEVAILDPNALAQPSFAQSDKGTFSSYFMSNTLNYIKKLETDHHTHNLVLTGSQQFNSDIANSNSVQGYNVPSNDIQVVSGIPQANRDGFSDYKASAMLSLLGQAQYDFDGKYILYASYRGDASSRFGKNSKWGYFPAAGIGWMVSDEKFMEKIKKTIPYLKIRASYGVTGSQSNNFYGPFNSYNLSGTYNGGTAIQPSYTNGLTKNDLTWTKSTQKNVGVDAQLFGNRITLSVDFYEKLSTDDYYDFNLPFFTGYQSINFNAHDLWINNKGVDITIGTKNLARSSPLQWNMQFTLSHNTNTIAKMPNNNRSITITDGYGVDRIFAVGQPLYEMNQLKYLGVYNNAGDIPFNKLTGIGQTYFVGNHKVIPGDPIWLDVNKDGDVWDHYDKIATGDPNPKFTGGWVNDFTYKNFSMSVLSVFTWKRTVVNTFFQQQISNIVGGYSSSINSFANSRLPDISTLNYWTPQKIKDNPNYKANFPSLNPFGSSYYQFIPLSSMFNEDGSYFKIKNIVLGYQLPNKVIKKLNIKAIKIYGIVDNVLTLKKGTMPNPELVDQLGIYTGGAYPTPTKITFGADIQF